MCCSLCALSVLTDLGCVCFRIGGVLSGTITKLQDCDLAYPNFNKQIEIDFTVSTFVKAIAKHALPWFYKD